MTGLPFRTRSAPDVPRARGARRFPGPAPRLGPAALAWAVLGLAVAGFHPVHGQVRPRLDAETLEMTAREPMEVPFEPGERLIYDVRFGSKRVGQGYLHVDEQLVTLRGRPTYRASMGLEGRLWPFSVDYTFRSWMDVATLASHRYIQDQKGTDARYRAYEIYPARQRWERADVEESGETITDEPMDQVSFLYFVRTLPLEVGDEYVLNHYFKEDGNPVIIRVLRKEWKEVPAGTFECIVIEPIIRTSGLFGDGGQAEIYLTADDSHRMVYMLSRIKYLPDIHLALTSIE